MNGFSAFLQLQKVDVSKRQVWGTAAIEQPDRAREIMDYEKSLPNFLNWSRDMVQASGGLSKGNVRAMHGDIAAGKVIHFEPRDDTKSIYVGAEIVDENEWQKVLKGVYTGFSVGGSYGSKWPDPVLGGYTRYEAKPVEISLVDVPCMPGAQFEVVKADGSSEMRKLHSAESMESVQVMTAQVDPESFIFTSVGVADLIKGAGMETKELLEKLNASADPAMQELAKELQKAFPSAKKEKDSEEESAPEGGDKEQSKGNPFTAKDKKSKAEDAAAEGETVEHEESETDEEEAQEEATGEESDEQTAGATDPAKNEEVRAIVIQLLEELGFVQEQGGQPGAPTAMKFVTVETLQKRMSDREGDLQKMYDEVNARQKDITADLAKLSTTVDEMEKRGGPAPVIRDLGSLTPESAGAMQKAALLRDVIDKTSDPIAKQALQAELTTLEIKKVQTNQSK